MTERLLLSYLTNILNRSVPFQLDFDPTITCVINDGSDLTCQDFIYQTSSLEQCNADISFNFTFTNVGFACVDISSIHVSLGPVGEALLSFDDVYNYSERELCINETWTIPDQRSNVNLCEYSSSAWSVVFDIIEFRGQHINNTIVYEWIPFSSSFVSPSLAPTIDTCKDCTLTGVVSGGKRYMNSQSFV